jgi:hypothetical protein
MLGLSKAGTAGASATANSARGRDIYQRYAAVLYRESLLNLDDSAYPHHIGALWRAVLRRLRTSSAAAENGDQA